MLHLPHGGALCVNLLHATYQTVAHLQVFKYLSMLLLLKRNSSPVWCSDHAGCVGGGCPHVGTPLPKQTPVMPLFPGMQLGLISWAKQQAEGQQAHPTLGTHVVVVAVVTLGQWDPHRCNRSATVSYTPGTAGLADTAEQPH
jgi:hypothetical protein